MTHDSLIRICSVESLRGQPCGDLMMQLMVWAGLERLDSQSPSEFVVCLEYPEGKSACMTASVGADGIARLGPIMIQASAQLRRAIWLAGIEWARERGVAAVQISCHRDNDGTLLADMGMPILTDICWFECSQLRVTGFDDDAILSPNFDRIHGVLTTLVPATLSNSLDLPEVLPFRTSELMIRDWMSGPKAGQLTLIAQPGNEPVGLLVASKSEAEYHINYLGVAANHRRQGWGARLLKQFLRLAHADGVMKASVFTDQRNVPAIRLYKQFGFRELEELRMPLVFRRMGESP